MIEGVNDRGRNHERKRKFTMKLFEYALLCASILSCLYVIWVNHRFRPLTTLVIPTSLLGILLLHLIIEHSRWIMFPVYGITTAVVIGCILRRRSYVSRPSKHIRSILLSLLALLAGGLSWGIAGLLPLFQFTEPSGPYSVGVMDYTWSA